MWLRQLARQAGASSDCPMLSGHTSRTGPAPLNQRLSLQRAQYVQQKMIEVDRGLTRRSDAAGLGSSKNISGTGTDDARDALDRRVEFELKSCPS